jgi:hypothetical protein
LKIKLKGRYFDTIDVIKAELQAMLKTLTEHDFQDAFKSGRSTGNYAYTRKATTSRWPVGLKLVLTRRWQYQSGKLWMAFCISQMCWFPNLTVFAYNRKVTSKQNQTHAYRHAARVVYSNYEKEFQ